MMAMASTAPAIAAPVRTAGSPPSVERTSMVNPAAAAALCAARTAPADSGCDDSTIQPARAGSSRVRARALSVTSKLGAEAYGGRATCCTAGGGAAASGRTVKSARIRPVGSSPVRSSVLGAIDAGSMP